MRKIILLTGLPRSGKTFVKNLLSLNPEIQTTDKEFFSLDILMTRVLKIEVAMSKILNFSLKIVKFLKIFD